MRRVARRLFTIVSGVSLLLCVAVCVLWARSYRTHDMLDRNVAARCWGVNSNRGRLALMVEGPPTPLERFTGWRTVPADPGNWIWFRRKIGGIGWKSYVDQWGTPVRIVEFPTGYLAIAFFLPALVLVARRLRSMRRWRTGHCVSCGYDLRASPERCPECGTARGEAA